MGYVVVAANGEDEPSDEEASGALTLPFPTVYFFLHREILRLRDGTGLLIDPQKNAYFSDVALDALDRFLARSRANAEARPAEWKQRVGILATGTPVEYPVTRAEVLEFLTKLKEAVDSARKRGMGVMFWGT